MERTRYFAFWHDGSTIGNHSHLLIIVNVLYGTASFLSDKEYQLKYKKYLNVQVTIEEPQLYLLTRCPLNDQQILYSEERVKSTTISHIKLQKQQSKLFDRLSKTDIIDELHQRAVKFTFILTKKGFMDILNYEMRGINTATLCIMV